MTKREKHHHSFVDAIAGPMGEEGGTVTFPEELMENIISRIPFPYIFKAKLLSRAWRSNFERVARSTCSQWPSYCPAFFDTRSHYFLGYDRVHNSWLKEKLNENVALDTYLSLKSLQKPKEGLFWEKFPTQCEVEGVLLCRVDLGQGTSIINLLTGKCRKVPDPPNLDQFYWADDVFSCFSSVIFPLEKGKHRIVLYGMRRDGLVVNYERRTFYDTTHTCSICQTWLSVTLVSRAEYHSCNTRHFAYLDGNMYYICSNRGARACLVQVQFEEKSENHQRIVLPSEAMDTLPGVLRCGSRIIVFILSKTHQTWVHLYEVDTETLSMTLLTENPLESFVFSPNSIIADRSFIYFYGSFCLTYYNVELEEWSIVYHDIQLEKHYLDQIGSVRPISLESGVNPFTAP